MEKMSCKKCGGDLVEMNGIFYCWSCDKKYIIENGNLCALVCKNCDGNLLVKDDCYVCELCGQRYKKPKPEVNILKDVEKYFGAGYRYEYNGSVEKEYSIARKYLSEKRYILSNNHYKKLVKENPSDWEALFYSAYGEIRENPDLQYSAKGLCKMLETVVGDIYRSVPKEKQKITCLEIGAECLNIGLFLIEKAEEEAKKSKLGDDYIEGVKNGVMEMMLTVLILIHNTFEDLFVSVTIAKTAKEICVYKKCGGELFDMLEENCSAIEEMIHKTEEQIEKIKAHISEISRMIEESPLEKEAEKLEKQIDSLNKQKESLGIFKAKEKKAIQAEIDGLRNKKGKIVGKLLAMEEAANEEIEYCTDAVKELTSKISY